MHFFKVRTDIYRDPKMRDMPASLKWLWVCFLALARESDVPGEIHETAEDIAWRLGESVEDVTQALQSFYRMSRPLLEPIDGEDKTMPRDDWVRNCDGWRIVSWERHQGIYASDSKEAVAERVRRHRERKKAEEEGDVTSLHVTPVTRNTCNAKRRGEERRVEESVALSEPTPAKRAKPRTGPCPEDLALDDDFRRWRDERYPEVSDASLAAYIETRRDRAIAKGLQYANWHLALKTWFREDFAAGKVSAPRTSNTGVYSAAENMRLYLDAKAKDISRYEEFLGTTDDPKKLEAARRKIAALNAEVAEAVSRQPATGAVA